jgi:hypothetical protein
MNVITISVKNASKLEIPIPGKVNPPFIFRNSLDQKTTANMDPIADPMN